MKYPSNIAAVLAHQPEYMGFIFYPKSARFVDEKLYDEILKIDFGKTQKVGVFVDESIEKILNIHRQWNFNVLQLHGHESPAYCEELKDAGVQIIKVFHIDEDFDFGKLADYKDCVDYFLFDTKTAKMGGSGKVFDWKLLQNYKSDKPLFLSGGIGLENLDDAMVQAMENKIYALDINSRLEKKPGLKDELLVKLFMRKMNGEKM